MKAIILFFFILSPFSLSTQTTEIQISVSVSKIVDCGEISFPFIDTARMR